MGRGKGEPEVWYGSRVCILAHERRPVGGGCALLFGIQTALGARSGPGCWLIPYVESGAQHRPLRHLYPLDPLETLYTLNTLWNLKTLEVS